MARSKKALALTLIYILVGAFQPKALASSSTEENKPKDSEVEKRRLVICLDGTWNSPHDEKKIDDGRQLLFKPTNVLKTCRSVLPIGADGVVQLVYYASGVGSAARFPGPANTVYAYMDKYLGGVWGAGFESNVASALTYLTMNYRKGDEVFLFGFSRGAATARGVTQFLRWAGGVPVRDDAYWLPFLFRSFIDHDGEDFSAGGESGVTDSQDVSPITLYSQNVPELLSVADTENNVTFSCDNMCLSPQANVQRFDEERCKQLNMICAGSNKQNRPKSCSDEKFNIIDTVEVPINFLGVWDTVMALGSRFEATGATTTPSPSQSFYVSDHPAPAVEVARQALAIDERRYDFRPEIWTSSLSDQNQDMKQRWFPGVHSNVGGGYVHDGLANGAFHWILGEAKTVGLEVDIKFVEHYKAFPQDCLYETYTFGAQLIDTVRWRRDKGIRSLKDYSSKYPGANLELDESVCERWAADYQHYPRMGGKPYRPSNVLDYFLVKGFNPSVDNIGEYCADKVTSHSEEDEDSGGLLGAGPPTPIGEHEYNEAVGCRQ